MESTTVTSSKQDQFEQSWLSMAIVVNSRKMMRKSYLLVMRQQPQDTWKPRQAAGWRSTQFSHHCCKEWWNQPKRWKQTWWRESKTGAGTVSCCESARCQFQWPNSSWMNDHYQESWRHQSGNKNIQAMFGLSCLKLFPTKYLACKEATAKTKFCWKVIGTQTRIKELF